MSQTDTLFDMAGALPNAAPAPGTAIPPAVTRKPAADPAPPNRSAAGAPTITITVRGNPAPQGSKRHVGGGRMIESSKHVRPWRDAVRSEAVTTAADTGLVAPLDGPLVVEMVFTLAKPASAPKRRRTWPMRIPDLSKLARSTEDALTDAGIWADDARVVEYRRLAKVFSGEDADALPSPGVVIRIYPLEADGA